EVWLLAPAGSGIVTRAATHQIATRHLKLGRMHFPGAVLGAALWFRKIRPDVVNPHSSRDGWIVGLAARLARVPLVIRSRHFHVPIPSPFVSKIAYGTLADHVITTSRQISQQLQDTLHLPADRVSTIATGIDPIEFSPTGPKADLRPAGISAETPLIGM